VLLKALTKLIDVEPERLMNEVADLLLVVERLAGTRIHEVVFAQPLDPAAGIGGKLVECLDPHELGVVVAESVFRLERHRNAVDRRERHGRSAEIRLRRLRRGFRLVPRREPRRRLHCSHGAHA